MKSLLQEVQELKIFVAQSTGISVDFGGSIVDLTAITQGDSDTTRDGDRVMLKEVTFRWVAQVGDAYNLVRVILFQYVPDSTGTPVS